MHKTSHIPNYVFFTGLLFLIVLLVIAYDMKQYKGYEIVAENHKVKLAEWEMEGYTEMDAVPGSNYFIVENDSEEHAVVDDKNTRILPFGRQLFPIIDFNTRDFTGLFLIKIYNDQVDNNEQDQLCSADKDSINTFAYISQTGADNRIFVRSADEKVGFINYQGDIVIKPSYNYFEDESLITKYCHFADDLCPVMDSMGKFGYIDDAGKKKIDFIYDLALPFDNSIAEVYKNGKANFINIMGDTLSQ